jgi:hypothetical protein
MYRKCTDQGLDAPIRFVLNAVSNDAESSKFSYRHIFKLENEREQGCGVANQSALDGDRSKVEDSSEFLAVF